jgi:hypothetical protein
METIPNGNQPVSAMRGNPLYRKTKDIDNQFRRNMVFVLQPEERITNTSCGFNCRDIDVGQALGLGELEKKAETNLRGDDPALIQQTVTDRADHL